MTVGKPRDGFWGCTLTHFIPAAPGIAAGMALCGKIVFTYSIGNFPTLRCIEQIRNDVCYHNADVKIVSVGGGLGYGALGMTHHNTEDIAMMRSDMAASANLIR